jgi:ribose transport system permease protein
MKTVDAAPTIAPTSRGTSHPTRGFGAVASRHGLLMAWAIVIVIFGALEPDTFLTSSNFRSIFGSQAVLLMLTLGLLPALTLNLYDLSIASVMGLSLVIVGWLNVMHDWPVGAAIAIALLVGLVVGVVNGVLVVVLGIEAIVVTLGMATALAGAAIAINNLAITGISQSLVDATKTQVFDLPASFYYGVAVTFLMWYVFRFTPLGRYLYFTGGSIEVARLSGIPVDRIRFASLIFSSFMAALCGVVLAGVLGASDPTVGPTYLLPAYAGAFLGATTVTPGRFNPWGTFVGIYFLVTGITGLQLVGLTGWIEQVFYGVTLVAAVVLSRLVGLRSARG